MSEEFKFSDPGEGLQEAEVLEIHVSEGDHVNDGDTVFTVETDKAATDIPAPFSGTVEKVHLKTGDVVRVDDVLLTYAPDDGAKPQKETEKGADESEKSAGEEEKKDAEDEEKENREGSKKRPRDDEEALDEEGTAGVEESAVDEETSEAAQQTEERADQDKGEKREAPSSSARDGHRSPVPASPSTRRIARERSVDLHDVEPSGPQGRVTTEDVEAAAKGEGPAASREKRGEEATSSASTLPDFSQWGETEREPMRSIRRVTAERLTQSWKEVPHVYHQDVADVTELERFRHDYEASAQVNGGKFTLTILMMKALVFALKQFPRFNASLDNENQEIVLKRYYNIGVAVATERGLLVPVIRDVDKKNLIELTENVTDTVEKARNGELGREDMEGASMTLTNPGPLGGTALTPLINLPEVAILGLGQARLEPVVHGDLEDYEIKPRLLLPLSLGFDHRVNDGADAANFVTTLIGALEDPQALLLKI